MKAEILRAAVQAQQAKRPVVLVRSLDTNEHWLIGTEPDDDSPPGLPVELAERCQAALRSDGASVIESDGHRYLLQTLAPPYRLIVVGAVHIAQALIPMARTAAYTPILVDPRPAFATAARFPGIEIFDAWPQDIMPTLALDSRSAVVTLSHDPKIDEPALAAALDSEAFYIGALGSRRNHAGRLERLGALGYAQAALARIAGPIGLSLGGRAPGEIAVAILAQIIQHRYQATNVSA